uniref:Reverse transcriptase domain-containing protein n=1 Tax=Tanacetum cinerariifolium TaxID=118510 RepID=A0A6L2J4L9_TANCI|nr:reverse transcriptase domain-containing protein [Tanacetum cinerariifolium]
MRTRSSSNIPVKSYPNPTSSNPKRRNRRRSKQPFILEESPVDTMADQRTMAELLRAPTEGYAKAIVVPPPILTEQFELKHSLINMMNLDQFYGLEKDNPHDHIRWFNKITSIIKYKDVPNSAIKLMLFPFSLAGAARRWLEKESSHSILTWEDLVSKFINEFFPLSRTTNLRNEISNFQQRFDESFHEVWDRYKDLLCACPHHGFAKLHQLDTFYNALNPSDQDSLNSAAGGNLLKRRTQDVLTIIENKSKIAKLTHAANQQTSAVTTAMTAILKQFQATPPPASVKAVEEIYVTCGGAHLYYQSITTRSGIVLDGPSVPMPPPFINPEEDERVEETLTDQDLAEDPGKFLIPCGLNELKCKALADLGASINLMPLSVWKNLGLPELISTRMTIELANRAICTPAGIAKDAFVSVGKFTFPVDFVIIDYESDPRVSLILGRPFLRTARSTTSSSPNHLLEEFADKLALITFPPGNDDLPFDIESDLKEIEYFLNHNPIKEMDSILKDSVDDDNLAEPNDNLVDTMPEMFIDEHALDYSSPPLYDEYEDDLFEDESDIEYVYDDPFDSKGEKIKESKLLIDELDLHRSSDFLPSPEYDSFLFENFFEVDALPSTNNEDKVFNPGILIQENLSEVITRVAPDKNVKKIAISNASLILEYFDPPLYELPFLKEVFEFKTLLSFSSENKKKVFKPRILTSKGVHNSLLPELSHRGHKAFKVIKILDSPMEIFSCLCGENICILVVPCLHFYPHERINSGVRSS